ncbi:MAG: recombinase family protein [Clostridia bacterium]|nr:recombinase family protein [Clostridia bacterium]
MIEVKKKKKVKGAKTVVEYSKLDRKVAALWTRVSTKEQEENNCSLENQRKICLEYAEQRGITIKKEFGGTHESAKNEGEMYRKMIAEVAKDKEINIILVYSFDRFSRAGTEAIMTKAYLKTKGIYVISATQVTDPDSAAGTFMENILFLFNQFENDLRRDKSVMGMTECLKRGYWFNNVPLGYDRKKVGREHIITVNEDGKKLRNAFIWKATEGMSDIAICERLKAMGLNVDRKHLNKIFQNVFYAGYMRHNLLGNEIVKGKHEALIDEVIFNKVNGISNAGYEHKKITDDFPLKRHIICSECGGYLTGYTVKARGKNYYKCNTKGCKNNNSAEKIHAEYVALLNSYKIPQEWVSALSDVFRKVFREHNDMKDEERRTLLKRRTECKQKIDKHKIRFGLDEISEDIYNASVRHLNTELAEIERSLESASQNLSNMEKFVDKAVLMCCQLGNLWIDGDFESRQELQKLVFPNGILLDKENGNYRTISLSQMSKGELACTLPWREIEGKANKKTRTKCSRLCACFGST